MVKIQVTVYTGNKAIRVTEQREVDFYRKEVKGRILVSPFPRNQKLVPDDKLSPLTYKGPFLIQSADDVKIFIVPSESP